MSNTTIEREIVQMVFEAKEFRKGIQDSIRDLGELQKSFQMNNAQRSLAELQKSSEIDFSVMANGIASINNKMSAMGVAAAAVVTNIANSIMDMGRNIADSLVFTPLTQGMEEYEIQLNAIQTILANTKKHGTTLEDVSAALQELNDYADLTIYNFAEMTKNIGTFTTAGVELDTSVAAIKGIANAAAMSGANAQQAASAMYQLSQAVSSGVVRLQDWMSVEKAGIGGAIFQESLIETAKVHGIAVDKFIEDNGSFRNSLSENWLSSDILLETLSKFTGDLTEAQLESMGYTEEQIVGILELGEAANDAATKIKTFTAFKDTMAEAMGSGWAQTWFIVLGDFEEAKELWGDLAGFFGTFIDASTEARNKMLTFWAAAGGREQLIEGIFNVLQAVANVLGAVKDAFEDIFPPVTAGTLLVLTKRFLDFSENLRSGSDRLERFKKVVRGIAAALSIVGMVISAVLSPLKKLIPGIEEGGHGFFIWLGNLADTIVAFREFAIETKFFDGVVSDVITTVKEFIPRLKELWKTLMETEAVQYIVECFEKLKAVDPQKVWEGFTNVAKAAIAPFYLLGQAIIFLCKWLWELKIVKDIVAWFNALTVEGIKKSFYELQDSIQGIIDSVRNSELLNKFLELFQTFDGRRTNQFLADAKENFGSLGDVIGKVKKQLSELGLNTEALTDGIKAIGSAIKDGLVTVLDYLIDNAGKIDYSQLFKVINTGLLGGILLALRNVVKGGVLGAALGEDVGESIGDIFETLEGTLGSFQNNIRADTLKKIAVALAILAASIFLLTLIDSQKLETATVAMAAMALTLFGASGAMSLIKTKDAIKAALAIIGLSIAIAIASLALKNVADIDPARLEDSLIAMGAGLAALVISVNKLSSQTGTSLIKTVGILMALGLALLVLSVSVRIFGEMEPDVLAQGLAGMAAGIAALVAAVVVISKAGVKGMIKAAAGIVILSGALLIMLIAVRKFGEMDQDVLTQGLISVGAILIGFGIFSRLLDPKGMLKASVGILIMSGALIVMAEAMSRFSEFTWDELIVGLTGMAGALILLVLAANLMNGAMAGAVAMGIMSLAMMGIAVALKLLSTLTWEELLLSLAALAGVFIIFGVAGYLLGPVVPVLLALGAAMLIIGAGIALVGLGLLLASIGLIAIAGSAALIAAGIAIVGAAIIELLPKLGIAIAEALVGFLLVIAEKTPELIEAFKTIILGMITAISELIPDIVATVLQMITSILVAIALAMPDLVQAGFDILLAFIKGIEDNIADIVKAGLGVITEFLAGIEDGIPDLVVQVFSLVLTFIESVEEATTEYMPLIVEAGLGIGRAIVDGVIQALVGGVTGVVGAIGDLANTALSHLSGEVEEDSPSKATYRTGLNVVLGFVNGIQDNIYMVKKAFGDIQKVVKENMGPLIQAMADDIDRGFEFSPVISPVLNLDNIDSGIGLLDKSFNNSRILAELSYDRVNTGVSKDPGIPPNGDGGVTFVQNNYSPKVLDRETIYRQTKTQVARLSTRVFEK